jgi:autotransporter-associated beta strand protein
MQGTLQIGNATGSDMGTGSISSTKDVNLEGNTHLIFSLGSKGVIFSKVIDGFGKVTKRGTGNLIFTVDHTYSGTTTISEGAIFLGYGGTSGSVEGNIINNSELNFIRSGAYTYSGVISGTGKVIYDNTGTLTLTGDNSYTGETRIADGTLTLGATGKIESSEMVVLASNSAAFNIVGNKTIQGLSANFSSAVVGLGANTLTIGTTGQDNGSGSFSGKFTGAGGSVIKTGTSEFTMTNAANTATGTLSLNEGTLKMRGGSLVPAKWAGNFANAAYTKLIIERGVAIGGNLALNGGNIVMNLIPHQVGVLNYPPSKIMVTGSVSAMFTNKIFITAEEISTPQAIITAASGITSLIPYEAITPGSSSQLSIIPQTELLIKVQKTDFIPPVKGTGLTNAGDHFTWKNATDNVTAITDLKYALYMSRNNNIATIENCENNGTLLIESIEPYNHPGIHYSGLGCYDDSGEGVIVYFQSGIVDDLYLCYADGLQSDSAYYFNVVVMDEAGNKKAYTSLQWTVPKADLCGHVLLNGNLVFGQTLTVDATTLFSDPVIPDMGDFIYKWKRGKADIAGATGSSYTLVQADLDSVISVEVSALHCTGYRITKNTEAVVKAEQDTPSKPTLQSATDTTITLYTIAGCQYRLAGGSGWQTSTIFNDLQPATTYYFEAYFPETATHFASMESEFAEFTTDSAKIENGIVEPQGNASLRVYPNPTTGELRIENREWRIENVEVFDVYGKKIEIPRFAWNDGGAKFPSNSLKGWQPQADGVVLNIAHLANGIYLLRIQTERGAVVHKIIKN